MDDGKTRYMAGWPTKKGAQGLVYTRMGIKKTQVRSIRVRQANQKWK